MRARATSVLAVALGVVVGGCGSSQPASPPVTGDGSTLYSCDMETRAQPYMAGMTQTSLKGDYVATLVASVPAPPAKGTDTWTVQIADSGGALVDGLTMSATPFMPDHNHGTSVRAVVTDMGGGTYEIAPLYLFMEGFWQITLALQPAAGTSDSVIFPVCIP